jgi:hypothetical protein
LLEPVAKFFVDPFLQLKSAEFPTLERPKTAPNIRVAFLPMHMTEATQVMLGHPRLRHHARSTDRQTLLP